MERFWYLYAAAVLGFLAWVVASPKLRRRYSAGGRELWPAMALFGALGVGALLNGLLDTTLGTLLALPVSLLLIRRQRRRLAGVPDEELAPYVRTWRVLAPTAGDLVRHPWRSTRATVTLLKAALGREGRAREKDWERANGLR